MHVLCNDAHFPGLICLVQIILGCECPASHVSQKWTLISCTYYFFFTAWWVAICFNAWSGCLKEAFHLAVLVPLSVGEDSCSYWSWKTRQPLKLNETTHPCLSPSSSHPHFSVSHSTSIVYLEMYKNCAQGEAKKAPVSLNETEKDM